MTRYRIKVTYLSTVFERGEYRCYKYTVRITVGPEYSMRRIASEVIKSSFGKIPNWLEKVNDDQPISIYLDGRSAEEKRSMPYGIGYDLRDNGNVIFLNERQYEPLSHDWTYRKILELNKAGYISGDVKHIIVETPRGLGGPGDIDLSILIADMLAFIGVFSTVEGVMQLKDRLISAITYRKMVKSFKTNGLYSLKQIRLLLDTNKTWKTQKVMRALSVKRNMAVAILEKLGYSRGDRGVWRFDDTLAESLKLREKWLEQEQNEEERISELIMKSFEEVVLGQSR